jgi:tetratricopeptide (TPR) repeat protein
LGNEHSDALNSMDVLGQVLIAQGQYPEAERYLHEAYDTRLRVLGRDHHDTAESAYDLGTLYASEGKKEEAIAMLTSAVDHGLLPKKDLDMGADPLLKSLKKDPAFDALLADARRHAGSSHN